MNKIILIIIALVVVGGGAFYGGMKYAESKSPQGGFARADLQNLSPEERQQKLRELGDSGARALGERAGGFGSGVGGRSLSGEIISRSEDSFTIKLGDDSTKIVFVSESTQITKSVEGNLTDLGEGEQIFVGGTENSDGSYTAKTIQLRPLNSQSNNE